jgi:hypothetical protein
LAHGVLRLLAHDELRLLAHDELRLLAHDQLRLLAHDETGLRSHDARAHALFEATAATPPRYQEEDAGETRYAREEDTRNQRTRHARSNFLFFLQIRRRCVRRSKAGIRRRWGTPAA